MLVDSEHFVYSVKGDFHDLRQETRLLAFFFVCGRRNDAQGIGSQRGTQVKKVPVELLIAKRRTKSLRKNK